MLKKKDLIPGELYVITWQRAHEYLNHVVKFMDLSGHGECEIHVEYQCQCGRHICRYIYSDTEFRPFVPNAKGTIWEDCGGMQK